MQIFIKSSVCEQVVAVPADLSALKTAIFNETMISTDM